MDHSYDESFMSKLNLKSFDSLDALDQKGRSVCSKCNKPRKFYCYDCMDELTENSGWPKLKLPCDVSVLRHPKEKRSKSSIIPAKIIAPDNVEILHTIDVP